jgi:Transposase
MRTHPGVELVCRDRAGAYAEAVRTAAPNATQVADRWHLWHNLLQAVEKTVIAERGALQAPEPDPQPESKEVAARPDSCPAEQPTTPLEGRLVIRTRQRYAAVQRLVAAGRSISAIGKELGLQRKTLRRFAFADSLDELLTTATTRGSLLDPFKPYLHQRFNAGHTDAARLTREITALGYRGSDKTVRRYLQPFRETLAATSPAPVPPSVRQVTGWLTCHPDRLTDDDRVQLKQVLARSDMLTITHQAGTRLRRIAHPTPRRAPPRVDVRCRRPRRGAPAFIHQRPAHRPGRRRRWADHPVQLRTGRRRHHPPSKSRRASGGDPTPNVPNMGAPRWSSTQLT